MILHLMCRNVNRNLFNDRKYVSATARQLATARQRDSATARQRDSATARQRDSATARQRDSATARQRDSATARQRDSATARQRDSATARGQSLHARPGDYSESTASHFHCCQAHVAIATWGNAGQLKPDRLKRHVTYRNFSAINNSSFAADLESLNISADEEDPVGLLADYDPCLRTIVDAHAPLESRTITVRPRTPWHTNDLIDKSEPSVVPNAFGGNQA